MKSFWDSFNLNDMYSDRLWSFKAPWRMLSDATGYTQFRNAQASTQTQIDYENYLRAGNERALRDWHKNVPNRQIRYPELSYPGQIYRSDTSIARNMYDYSTAGANYTGNLIFRLGGLYGVANRLSRSL